MAKVKENEDKHTVTSQRGSDVQTTTLTREQARALLELDLPDDLLAALDEAQGASDGETDAVVIITILGQDL